MTNKHCFKMKSVVCMLLNIILCSHCLNAQLKFVIEDFEGFADGHSDLKLNGVFTYGHIKASVDYQKGFQKVYSGDRYISLYKGENISYGGWGKGLGLNVELDAATDHLNFYIYQQSANDKNTIHIELQEDDNSNGSYEKETDDSWTFDQELESGSASAVDKNSGPENPANWKLISIPLNEFKDNNKGGDGIFNVSYKKGKLLCFIINFVNSDFQKHDQGWSFDFVCFSKGKLPAVAGSFDLPSASQNDFCSLGAWSKEGNTADFVSIATGFENNFKYGSDKKLGVVHFFQPFSVDGGNKQNMYPSVERINKVINQGYIPMITLEDHFVNTSSSTKQPNLYSIVEGHFDPFIVDWSKQIKQVNGVVLLRILHEFNGDWYPWCIANNDNDAVLLVKAFRHIHSIFKTQGVTNVKFIWCPNSMSLPQATWNFIMDAYPGDEFVDYVGLDIYNGAGKGFHPWRSFRKEGIENYFILTQQLSHKPLFICEIASRERDRSESKTAQDKAEWIRQMSLALNSDMSKVRLLTWFNEKGTFKISSSSEAQGAFLDHILKNSYFKSGTENMYQLIR